MRISELSSELSIAGCDPRIAIRTETITVENIRHSKGGVGIGNVKELLTPDSQGAVTTEEFMLAGVRAGLQKLSPSTEQLFLTLLDQRLAEADLPDDGRSLIELVLAELAASGKITGSDQLSLIQLALTGADTQPTS